VLEPFGRYGAELDGTRDAPTDVLAHREPEPMLAAETAVMVGNRAFAVGAANANGIARTGAVWGFGSRPETGGRGCAGHLRCARRPSAAGLAVSGRGRCGLPPVPRAVELSHPRARAAADARGRRPILDTRGNRCFKVRAL
jgi:hypothetical protein